MSTLDAIERQHILILQRISSIIQGIIERGLSTLLMVWPKGERQDALPSPGITTYPTVLSRKGSRILQLTDAELQKLWPAIPPSVLRTWAPWAVSYAEVTRISGKPGTSAELQQRVQAAIALERAAAPRPNPPVQYVTPLRARNAFQLRFIPESLGIFDQAGNPIDPPPLPAGVTIKDIEEQISWCRLALSCVVRRETIESAVQPALPGLERVTHEELKRVLAIDVAREVPLIARERERWYDEHVRLITNMTSETLSDIHRVLSEAHADGLRVEALAGELVRRYEVSESRAELIARDQILKANGRIMRVRQEAVGIREYIWITSRDRRVRESHVKLHGTKQNWAAPPPVGGGRHEHPGQDYQCRCIAKPVPPAWLVV